MSQSYDVLAVAGIRHLSTLDDTGGGVATPLCVSELSVVELSRKDQQTAVDETRIGCVFVCPRSQFDPVIRGQM